MKQIIFILGINKRAKEKDKRAKEKGKRAKEKEPR